MNLGDLRPECNDVAGSLQPFVDGELTPDEQDRISEHLVHCAGCRVAVSEQLWVRTALRSVERERAPQALRARIQQDLDQEDVTAAERANADAPFGDRWRRWMSTGPWYWVGRAILPATAVAGALFVIGQRGATPVEAMPSSLATIPRLHPINSERTSPTRYVELVGAQLEDTAAGAQARLGARLRFRVVGSDGDKRGHVIDWQEPAGGPSPLGVPVTFRGHRYLVGRGDDGDPFVHFVRGGVSHHMSLEPGQVPVGPAPLRPHVEEEDVAVLLDVAAHQIATGSPASR